MRKFNEMSAYTELKSVGLNDEQAKKHAALLTEVVELIPNYDALATKQDIMGLEQSTRKDIMAMEQAIRRDITAMEQAIRIDIMGHEQSTRKDIMELEKSLNAFKAELGAINKINTILMSLILTAVVLPLLKWMFGY